MKVHHYPRNASSYKFHQMSATLPSSPNSPKHISKYFYAVWKFFLISPKISEKIFISSKLPQNVIDKDPFPMGIHIYNISWLLFYLHAKTVRTQI